MDVQLGEGWREEDKEEEAWFKLGLARTILKGTDHNWECFADVCLSVCLTRKEKKVHDILRERNDKTKGRKQRKLGNWRVGCLVRLRMKRRGERMGSRLARSLF